MPHRIIHDLALSCVILSLLCGSVSAQAQVADLTVHIHDADPATGTAEVSLFNSAESFMGMPFLQLSVTIGEDGSQDAVFSAVPTGEYAVVVAHDADGNGQFDSGFLGFGAEPYAWSNNVRPWFGWPDFDEVRFSVEADTEIEISLE